MQRHTPVSQFAPLPSIHHLLPKVVLDLQQRREIFEAMVRSRQVPMGPAIGTLDLAHSMTIQRFLSPSMQAVMHAGLPMRSIPALLVAIAAEGAKSPAEMRDFLLRMLVPPTGKRHS